MKIFFSESTADYKHYTFNYAVYCMQENTREIPGIYARGFLPYSDHRLIPASLQNPVYYLARSIRIDTANFRLTSENRRIRRKIEENLLPHLEIINKENFKETGEMMHFCNRYAHERMQDAMPADRLSFIWNQPLLNKIFIFKNKAENDEILGYVWAVDAGEMLHYWFSFYALKYFELGLGKWMMEQVISQAAETGKKYVYLGTCYGKKATYKIRDFKGIEFFDGNKWNTDIRFLKQKCISDENKELDDFKMGYLM